jgi:DNA repair protein RadC
MPKQIYQSNAYLSFHQGENLQDLQILIEDPALFAALPGKLEYQDAKTLISEPFFLTAILKASTCSTKVELTKQAVRETMEDYQQLVIFDLREPNPPSGEKSRKRKVAKTLAQLRQLHEELNTQLYSHPTERPAIHSPSDAAQILTCFLAHLDHEELWVVNLDTRNRVMSLVALYKGSVNASQVRVSEVFRQAILDNAPSILVAHNHPSGDASPSPDDVATTRAIVQAGKLLDIELIDHLVIGKEQFVSLKERGLGF